MHIWKDVEKNMVNTFCCCWLIILKIVDVWVDITYTLRNSPDRTIFIKKFPGEQAHGPPSTSVNPNHNRATKAPGI